MQNEENGNSLTSTNSELKLCSVDFFLRTKKGIFFNLKMCGFSSDRNERDSESRHLFDLLYGFIFTVDYHQLSFTICECVFCD